MDVFNDRLGKSSEKLQEELVKERKDIVNRLQKTQLLERQIGEASDPNRIRGLFVEMHEEYDKIRKLSKKCKRLVSKLQDDVRS